MENLKPEGPGMTESLEFLVEEMLKDQPHEESIRQHMQIVGIPYSSDPIERLNTVLLALHPKQSHPSN